MGQSTAQQRNNWRTYECNSDALTRIAFGPDQILVAPPTVDAWKALASVLAAHEYKIDTRTTDSYCCRAITGGTEKSLHAYGIALDVNPDTNPYQRTPDKRKVRFSAELTQEARARDVRLQRADTDMTAAMIADVMAIKTKAGKTVFDWGGNWDAIKDTMHFEMDVTPTDLAAGIDWATVKGANGIAPETVAWIPQSSAPATVPVGAAGAVLGKFELVYPVVEKWEGLYSNDPDDPGGPTNMGITQQDLARWRQRPVSVDEVRDLTRTEARQIFRAFYYDPIHGDELPLAAAQVCYNSAVLEGVVKGGKYLQQALRQQGQDVAIDGAIGPQTIAACGKVDIVALVTDYTAQSEARLRSLPLFPKYGKGWLNRLNDVRSVAMGMAKMAPAATSTATAPLPAPSSTQDNAIADLQARLRQLEALLNALPSGNAGVVGPIALAPASGGPPPLVLPMSPLTYGSKGPEVGALQQMLVAAGYTLGDIDSEFGSLTLQALLSFQADNHLTPTGLADAQTMAALAHPAPRPLSHDRVVATADDLREKGSQTIKQADNTKLAALVSTILGALGVGNSAIVQMINSQTGASVQGVPSADISQLISKIQALVAGGDLSKIDVNQVNSLIDAARQVLTKVNSPEALEFASQLKNIIPPDVLAKFPQISTVFQQIDAFRQAKAPLSTILDILPGVFANGTMQTIAKGIAAVGSSVIPGFGGSLLALGVGLAANLFANKIITARTNDHATAANTGR